jgi:hypothetical protein
MAIYNRKGKVRRHAFSGGMFRKVVMGGEDAQKRLEAHDYEDDAEKQDLENTVKLGENAQKRIDEIMADPNR